MDGPELEGTVQCSVEMPSWREVGLFDKQSQKHLDSYWFIRDTKAYLSVCLWQLLLNHL